jgi:ABC-type uncharacterized transport system permease subunit
MVLIQPVARSLSVLLIPYLTVFALSAVFWSAVTASQDVQLQHILDIWLKLHILFAEFAYGAISLAAVAAVAVFVQERALKKKQHSPMNGLLPSLSEGETLQRQLLILSETVLGLGLVTGMAAQYFTNGTLIVFDHKTLLTSLAFIVIAALLFATYQNGVRGRQAARFVLFAYLLITLGYPGVKFITDILL